MKPLERNELTVCIISLTIKAAKKGKDSDLSDVTSEFSPQ